MPPRAECFRGAKRAQLVTALRATCFLEFNSRKHSCVPSVASASRLPHGASCLLTTFENIPHEEVFRGMQILWIDIESLIALWQSEQRNTRSCLSGASSSSDLKNLCSGLRAQDVFAPFFVSFLSVMKEMKDQTWGRWMLLLLLFFAPKKRRISPLRLTKKLA